MYDYLFFLQLMKEFPLLGMLNIHENLLEALLELQAYADVQAVLAKYDGMSNPDKNFIFTKLQLSSPLNLLYGFCHITAIFILSLQISVCQNQPLYATRQHC